MTEIYVEFSQVLFSSYQARITGQLKRLGTSFDWDRVAFTMNDVCLYALSQLHSYLSVLFS